MVSRLLERLEVARDNLLGQQKLLFRKLGIFGQSLLPLTLFFAETTRSDLGDIEVVSWLTDVVKLTAM